MHSPRNHMCNSYAYRLEASCDHSLWALGAVNCFIGNQQLSIFTDAGTTVHTALMRLLAVLLVLKLLATQLPSQFPIQLLPTVHSTGKVEGQYESKVKKAVAYAAKMVQMHPSLCGRLELGYNWDSATEDILLNQEVRK